MRRKGVPCACDPCKGKNYVRAVNNVSPDPNGDLNLIAGTGIGIQQTGDDSITITNTATPQSFIAGRNIELNPDASGDISIDLAEEPVVDGLTVNGDTQLNGDLEVNGDIIQNGSAYETHAEHVFTRDDYIIMRDGAVSGLPQGDYSGFQVKLYDGTNDGRLVIDRDGVARVGDVGDEQPLMTREESGQLTDGALFKWDANNLRAVDEGTVGSDIKPIKLVNGVATPVSNNLQTELSVNAQELTPRNDITGVTIARADSTPTACRFITYGKMAILNIALTITGTRSGSSGWYPLFPDLDLNNYYVPYLVKTNSASDLLLGCQYYFANGQTYNETVNVQIIMSHT